MTAVIDISPETDGNMTNNVLQSLSPVQVRILGDINGDGKVDISDAIQFAGYFDLQQGDKGWNVDADLDHDGKVTIIDVIMLALNFGKTSS